MTDLLQAYIEEKQARDQAVKEFLTEYESDMGFGAVLMLLMIGAVSGGIAVSVMLLLTGHIH